MRFPFFGIYIYITRYRMKRRDKLDDVRRNNRGKINRANKRIYKNNGCVCSVCGNHFPLNKLQAHHIKSVSEYPRLIAKQSNILLVCDKCHLGIHTHRKEAVNG